MVAGANDEQERERYKQAYYERKQYKSCIEGLQDGPHTQLVHTGEQWAAHQLAERPGYGNDNDDKRYKGEPEQLFKLSLVSNILFGRAIAYMYQYNCNQHTCKVLNRKKPVNRVAHYIGTAFQYIEPTLGDIQGYTQQQLYICTDKQEEGHTFISCRKGFVATHTADAAQYNYDTEQEYKPTQKIVQM
jgi:hypothetical protein